MKRTTMVLAMVLLLAPGCSTTHTVQLGHEEQWMPDAQGDLLNRDAKAITTDGGVIEGTIIRLNADSLCVKGAADGKLHRESLDRVSSIRQSPRVWPAVGGFLGGALIGGALGGTIAMGSSRPEPEVFGFNWVAEGMAGATLGALIGAAVGGVGLGLATAVTDYTFVPAPVRRSPARPAPADPDSLRNAK